MKMASFMLMVALGCLMMQTTNGLIHVVGGAGGWIPPPDKNFYDNWAAHETFNVGDELVFPFSPGSHSVIQVLEKDFLTCGHDKILNEYIVGPTRTTLNLPGDYYFYCGVGTHCEMGQKLHITVKPGHARKLLSSGEVEMS